MNERNDNAADEIFAQKAKRLFDESVENLDGETRSRLNRGRQAALEEVRPGSRVWMQWGPVAGVTAAAIVAVVLWTGEPPVDTTTPAAADFEILLAEDSLEMLENLEFYSWVEFEESNEAQQPI